MKKILIGLWIALLPVLMMAATPPASVFGNAQAATTQTGTLIGTLLFVVVVSVWMLPIIFGVMVYGSQKKKAEQQHEDMGIKGALFSLIAIIIGAAASFYVVGTIGNLADDTTTTLEGGNTYFLKPLFDKGQANI